MTKSWPISFQPTFAEVIYDVFSFRVKQQKKMLHKYTLSFAESILLFAVDVVAINGYDGILLFSPPFEMDMDALMVVAEKK